MLRHSDDQAIKVHLESRILAYILHPQGGTHKVLFTYITQMFILVRLFLGWSGPPGSRALSGPALFGASPSAIDPDFRALVSSYTKGYVVAIAAGSLHCESCHNGMWQSQLPELTVKLLLHCSRCIPLEAGLGP